MDWFYHDPGQGRVGPLSADELRTRFRERRIERDTLVWREGMREWQPLDRVADELDLLSVKQDASRPPPLPPGAPAAAVRAPAYAASPAYGSAAPGAGRARPAQERKRMSGCLIALIVVAVLAVPMIAILAAIALPAYNDYVVRSKVVAQVDARAAAIQAGVAWGHARLGRCPADAQEAGLSDVANVEFGTVDGGACAFRITLQGVNAKVDGSTVDFVSQSATDDRWDCTGGNLPARYRSTRCRPDSGASTP